MRTVNFSSGRPASRSRRPRLSSLRFIVLACALLVFAASAALAQLPMAPHVAPSAAPAESSPAQAGKPAKGLNQGIVVHGYWKIDIRNPDGSLARHVEFENELAGTGGGNLQADQSGGALLASLLEGSVGSNTTSPLWGQYSQGLAILLSGANNGPGGFDYFPLGFSANLPLISSDGPCGTYGGTGTDCILTSTTNPLYDDCLYGASLNFHGYTTAACVPGLTTTANFQQTQGSLVGFISLTLQGAVTAGENSTILSVATLVTTCTSQNLSTCAVPATPGPTGSPNAIPNMLTYYAIPAQPGASTPGIPITQGQTAAITVTLSFS